MKDAFGAEEVARHAAPDGRVMHAEVKIGDSIVEMGEPENPAPSALHLYVEDADAAYNRALQAGAASLYPMTDQPYGDREGGVKIRSATTGISARTRERDIYRPVSTPLRRLCIHKEPAS